MVEGKGIAVPLTNDDDSQFSIYTPLQVFGSSLVQTAVIYPAAQFMGVFMLTLVGAISGRYFALSAYLCMLAAFLLFSVIAGYISPHFAFWRGLASFMWMTAFDAVAAKIFEQPSIYPWQATEVWIICFGTAVGMVLCAIACGAGGWARRSFPAWLREELEEFYESIGLPPPFSGLTPDEIAALRARLFDLANAADNQLEADDGFLVTCYDLSPPDEDGHRCAATLLEIVKIIGWPSKRLVGEDGANAAWRALQRTVGIPHVQRLMLPRLIEAAGQGESPTWQPAVLEDRIRIFEGRPQLYGTHLMWEAPGRLAPWPLEAPASVDKRRRMLGLAPLAQCIARRQAQLAQTPLPCPPLAEWQKEMATWAQRVGWRHPAAAGERHEDSPS